MSFLLGAFIVVASVSQLGKLRRTLLLSLSFSFTLLYSLSLSPSSSLSFFFSIRVNFNAIPDFPDFWNSLDRNVKISTMNICILRQILLLFFYPFQFLFTLQRDFWFFDILYSLKKFEKYSWTNMNVIVLLFLFFYLSISRHFDAISVLFKIL